LAGAIVCAGLFAALGSTPAFAAGWQLRELPIGEPIHASLHGVSCPSASLCVAVGETDSIAVSTSPTGGAGDWRIVQPYDAAVESDNRCFDPSRPVPVEAPCPVPPQYRQLRAVDCPTTTLCVAVSFDGYVYSTTDPTGPAGSWHLADVDGRERDTHLESVSCPDPGFCVAVSGDRNTAGKVLTSTDPTGPGTAWQEAQLDPSLDLRGVSCVSRSFCLAVASKGRILRSTDPQGGAAAWESIGTPGGPGDLEAVACVDSSSFLCLAGNVGGNLLSTTAAGAELSTWRETNGGASVQVTGASCPSPTRCVAVDNNGDVTTSSDPGAAGSWSSVNLIEYTPPANRQPVLNALFAASCPASDLCVLAGTRGRIFTSTDPFAAGPSSAPGSAGPGRGKSRRLIARPRTKLLKADGFREITRHQRLKARFRFFANAKVRGFLCKRDRQRYRRCHSPLRYWVPLGDHVLRVRAIGVTGLRGPVATIRFTAVHNPAFD
jgi:hypothetical protein